jgi:hypothetical protein
MRSTSKVRADQQRRSGEECLDRRPVGRVDAHQPRDLVEGPVRREDRRDPAVEGDGGEDRVAGAYAVRGGE